MDESEQPPAEGVGDGVVRAQYDWSSTRPSAAVIESIAMAVNCAPTEVEPLYDYVDPDALDAMMQSKSAARNRDITTVVFTFAEYEVTVYSDGEVVVEATT